MLFADEFSYTVTTKTLLDFEDAEGSKSFNDILVAFIQVEKEDEEEVSKKVKKLIKSIKWAAGKNKTKNVLLHSFAHLSSSKADPKITKEILDKAEERLKNVGFTVEQTPFGYFLDLKLSAPGVSQARIFQDL
ncbi:MAG: threonyl-tRNA synthetase editing domain-containing protein [Caldisericaceae bacterium]|nr:threonyl-tRNA synthetase editing domain-containing protein [Caldisericaceae bacterium]